MEFLRPTHPYVATWQGFVYVAFVIDTFARRIVGWSMAEHLKAGLCLDALVMALQRCQPPRGFIHHSDSKNALASHSWAA